jgi:predicted O-methyltransferase YrrM
VKKKHSGAKKLIPGKKYIKKYKENVRRADHFEKLYYEKNHLYEHFQTQFAPGHFYSPYPDLNEIESRKDQIFDRSKVDLPGIDIRDQQQLVLLKKLAKFYKTMPHLKGKATGLRYYLGKHAYSYTDGIILYCMLRHLQPKRVIEIGSGYSSALMLDVREKFLPKLDLTFVEPYPELLMSLIKPDDTYTLIDKPLHEVDLKIFSNLEAGDILFVDSTHVAKPGSDVIDIYFKILPVLKKGVIIHIHDIFYPFEYPIEWIKETRAWNEDYIVRAFLYNNNAYEIILFNHYLNAHHQKELDKLMPDTSKNGGGSLWLKKLDADR